MEPTSPGSSICTYKFILVGNTNVGKTVAAQSFAKGRPNSTTQYKSTIGVDYALKEFSINSNTTASVQLWDIAGEQRFGTMTRTYFRGSNAAIIMFDLTNIVSWEDVDIWRKDISDKLDIRSSKNQIPIVIVGNKSDLLSDEKPPCVADDVVESYVSKFGIWKYVKISARTDTIFTETLCDVAKSLFEQKSQSDSKLDASSKKTLKLSGSPTIPQSSQPTKNNTRETQNNSKTSTKAPRQMTDLSSSNHRNTPPDEVYSHVDVDDHQNDKKCCTIS